MQDAQAARLTAAAMSARSELLNLLAGSAMSSDISSVDFQRTVYSEDAVLDRGPGFAIAEGVEAIAGIMHEPNHLAMVEAGMAHLASQPFILVDGDSAVACGYLQVVDRSPVPNPTITPNSYAPHPRTFVVTANEWRFERIESVWRVVRRTIRDALSEEGRDLIRGVIERPDVTRERIRAEG